MSCAVTDDLRATLSTTLPLLHAFNHRHRNQHHASSWWPTFGVFRRALAKIATSLESEGHISRGKRHGIDAVRTRVVWLSTHLLPRAFVAFSQLMTDNQHAPLGLLLLALLARVHAACAKWLPQDKPPAQPEQMASTLRRGEQSGDANIFHADAIDKGVAISRNNTLAGVENHAHTGSSTKEEGRTSKQIAPSSVKDSEANGMGIVKKKKKKKNKNKEDILSSLFGSLV